MQNTAKHIDQAMKYKGNAVNHNGGAPLICSSAVLPPKATNAHPELQIIANHAFATKRLINVTLAARTL